MRDSKTKLDEVLNMRTFIRYSAVLLVVTGSAIVAQAQQQESLTYRLEPDKQVHYRVTIVFDSPTEKHTMSGVIGYTGVASGPGGFTLKYEGGLNSVKRAKGRSRFGGPRRFGVRPGGPPPGLFGRKGVTFDGLKQTTSELTVKPNGDVTSVKSQSQLPYLLGNLSILPFEALADQAEAKWQSGNGITVTQEESSGPSRSPFRGTTTTINNAGSELSKYEITRVAGPLVSIKKTYELKSPAINKDDNEVNIHGTGTFVFNKELSMPESLNIKYDYVVHQEGSKISIPLTVNYKRLSADELKSFEEKQAFVKKNPGINTEGAPWTKEVQGNIIKELQSTDVHIVQRRLVRLAARKPFLEETEVAEAIRPLLDKGGQTGKMAGMAWRRWKLIVPKLAAEVAASAAKEKAGAKLAATADNPFEDGDTKKPTGRELRFWTDKTGAFKVEAEFVELNGDSVVLKRKKDGRVIQVPLSKLSEADQKLAKQLGAAKPENPFE